MRSRINLNPLIDAVMVLMFLFGINLQIVGEQVITKTEAEAAKLEAKLLEVQAELAMEQAKSGISTENEEEGPEPTIDSLLTDLKAAKEALTKVIREKNTQEEEIEKLNTEMAALKTALETSEALVKSHETKLAELETALGEAIKREKTYLSEIEELEKSTQDLTAQLVDKQTKLAALESALERSERLAEARQTEVVELKDKLKSSQETLAATVEAQKLQLSKITTLEAEIRELEANRGSGSGDGDITIVDLKSATICNNLNYDVDVAIAHFKTIGSVSRGWYKIDKGDCKNFELSDNNNNYIYYTALKSGSRPNTNIIGDGFCLHKGNSFSFPNGQVSNPRYKNRCPYQQMFSQYRYVGMTIHIDNSGSTRIQLN